MEWERDTDREREDGIEMERDRDRAGKRDFCMSQSELVVTRQQTHRQSWVIHEHVGCRRKGRAKWGWRVVITVT